MRASERARAQGGAAVRAASERAHTPGWVPPERVLDACMKRTEVYLVINEDLLGGLSGHVCEKIGIIM
jgi:hypothetical protein